MNNELAEKEAEINIKQNFRPSSANVYTTKQPFKKKNRTLQFYKFLLNSLKVEICLNEFYQVVKVSNQSEILIWIISMSLFYTGNREFPLVWVHVLHLIRAIIGIFIVSRLPRSYEVIEYINGNQKLMFKDNFNDVIRDSVKEKVIPKLESMRCIFITYFSITFFNFLIDIIDFLFVISFLSVTSHRLQIVTLTFVILNFLYISKYITYPVIDLSYVFWTCSLKLTFSADLINDVFSGMLKKLRNRMKLSKKKEVNKIGEVVHDKKEQKVADKHEEKQSVIDLNYKQENHVKKNKDYDSLQIDFDHNIQSQYINYQRKSLNRTVN